MPNFRNDRQSKDKILTIILFYGIIFLTFYIYTFGLTGLFILDDIHNLETLNTYGGITNKSALMNFVFSNTSGPTGRPVAMLSFLINDQYWPGSAASYKATNILLHTLCGVLIFYLLYVTSKILNLTDQNSQRIALASMGLWLLHPLNVSTTLYVVQRMTILMTLFSLSAIIFYLYLRKTDLKQQWAKATFLTLTILSFVSLSILSKENGVLLYLFILVIEYTILNKYPKSRYHDYWRLVFILLPVIVIIIYFIHTWDITLQKFDNRNFTITERLLSEARILVSYLWQIIFPRNAGTGLFHDNLTVSTGLFSPITTFISILFIAVLFYTSLRLRKQQPVYSFAVLWYFSAHALESTFLPLELYFEHRNYMAMVGPMYALVYYISYVALLVKKRITIQFLKSLPVVILLLFGTITYQSTKLWGDPLSLFAIWAYENPKSIRSQLLYAKQLEAFDEHTKSTNTLMKTLSIYPNDITLPLHLVDISCRHNIALSVPIKELMSINDQSIYRGSVLSPLKSIIKQKVNNTCKQLLAVDLHDYMRRLVKVPTLTKNRTQKAPILYLHADYYVAENNLSSAMELLDKAFKLQPTVDIALRQTVLLYSAGLYEDAYIYLEKAIEADSTRKLFTPSRKKELDIVKNSIMSKLSE